MNTKPLLLGVNIDHVATLRQVRGATTLYPEPLQAAMIAEHAGADGITIHLREDRRHIQDKDVLMLKEALTTRMNLEMAVTESMIEFACKIRPHYCCFVPEKRQELTTEGGLDVVGQITKIKTACQTLAASKIAVSLFIDPDKKQVDASVACGAPIIEIHTGDYAAAKTESAATQALARIAEAAAYAHQAGLQVNAGHGLNYQNVTRVAALPQLVELNIGHAIIAQAIFSGLAGAVKEMKRLMLAAREKPARNALTKEGRSQ